MNKGKLIIVDDNKGVLNALKIVLQSEFEQVITISNPNLLVSKLESENFDVVLLDMNFTKNNNSGNEGFYWLKEIKTHSPSTEVVMFTAYGEIDLAVRALKEGAFDFVVKPWQNEKLIATLQSAYQICVSKKEVKELKIKEKEYKKELSTFNSILIGKSPAILKVLDTMQKVAPTNANILLTGENGTGKSLFAKEIHQLSLRREEAFVLVDMASLPESLFESELFGHKKGAFTDAKDDRAGKFLLAHNGTLFLDEIANLPYNLQSKLLTSLQTRQITAVGSDKSVSVDIRLICATNTNLEQQVAQNLFRQDLLYRINTIHIEIPPLRDRNGDIELLASYFLEQCCKRYNKPVKTFGTDVLRKMKCYRWSGNVRELGHSIERAVILSEKNVLSLDDFHLKNAQIIENTNSLTLEDMEKQMIIKALRKYEENMSAAATHLGVSRQTLYNKMKKYDL